MYINYIIILPYTTSRNYDGESEAITVAYGLSVDGEQKPCNV